MNIAARMLLCLAFSCGSLFAALIPQTFVFVQTNEPFTLPVILAQFNPAAGTLTGITVRIEASSTSSATVTNNSSSSSVSFSSASDLFLADSFLPALVYGEALPLASASAPVAPGGTATFSLTAQQISTTTYIPFSGNVFQGTADNGNPTTLISTTPFIGTGNYFLSFNGDDHSFCGPAGSGCDITSRTGGGTVTLTYVFTPASTTVPEPATFALCTLLFAGIPVLLRGQRKSNAN